MPTPRMFNSVQSPSQYTPPMEPDNPTVFNWDRRLSIEAIRTHTKTTDIPVVTDEQLELYRAAAIEAAELYTGLLLSGQRTIIEPIDGPSEVKPWKTTYRHRLKYAVADGIVHLYGSDYVNANVAIRVPEGATTVKIPVRIAYVDTTNCCDPCAQPWPINKGMMAAYRAGFKCPEDVPAGIVLGMLQFIAWAVEHPGDELLTQRNKQDALGNRGISGSNNIAMVSGALETWRMYDPMGVV